MAQSTILAAAQTPSTSTDVVVAAGAVVNVGLFVAAGVIPSGFEFPVMMDTPGADTKVGSLNEGNPVQKFTGPGTLRVKRNDISLGGVNVGVFLEA